MNREQESGKTACEHNNDRPSYSFETSVLFEAYFIWVLAGLLMIAIWFRFIQLILISTFMIFLHLIITLWKKASLKHLVPTLQIKKDRLFPEEKFQIQATIHNKKWLPLIWLEWIFLSEEGIFLGDETEEVYTLRLLWLLWHQKMSCVLEGKALQRGVYNIGRIKLCSGDGFRFSEIEQIRELNKYIFVYPKLIPVHIADFKPSMIWGTNGKKGGILEDPAMVIGTREYQAGDELRKVNWKASARTGKLQTNVYQPVVTKQLMIYIDVQGFEVEKISDNQDVLQRMAEEKKETFEELLSIIASVAVQYKAKGIHTGLISNALDYKGDKAAYILPSSDLTLFLDQLAKMKQQASTEETRLLDEIWQKGNLEIPLFIFCHHITEMHFIWFQRYKHKFSEVCFYYHTETEYSKTLGTKAKPYYRTFSAV